MDFIKGLIGLTALFFVNLANADQLEFFLVEVNKVDACQQTQAETVIPTDKSATVLTTGTLTVQPNQSFRLVRRIQENNVQVNGKLTTIEDNPQQKLLSVRAHLIKANKDANEVSTDVALNYGTPVQLSCVYTVVEPDNTQVSELWFVKLTQSPG